MNQSSNKRIILVGLFVILGILFFLSGILIIGNIHETFTKKLKVTALFDDVSGLQIGNNIWFSGVKIGVVNKLHFYGKSQVEVTMKIDVDSRQYIRKDAFVKIGTDGLIGNKILVIYGGSALANEVHEGDTLEVEKTFTNEDMINMLQENNKNVLEITTDFKTISHNVLAGEGSIGKLLKDDAIYDNMNNATKSLQLASAKAQVLMNTLNDFSEGFNKKGSFANDLVNDTMVFNSIQKSAAQLQQMTVKANSLVAKLNEASSNPNSALGVLLYDEVSGSQVKETLKNLESSSEKLDENLEALQHNFLLRGFFKR
ncbi:MAG TPA: MlaD family protein, partial [Chitinophagaceae bacterium]|nr:MlaD family protein [Chitinophagaceae bacterium]